MGEMGGFPENCSKLLELPELSAFSKDKIKRFKNEPAWKKVFASVKNIK